MQNINHIYVVQIKKNYRDFLKIADKTYKQNDGQRQVLICLGSRILTRLLLLLFYCLFSLMKIWFDESDSLFFFQLRIFLIAVSQYCPSPTNGLAYKRNVAGSSPGSDGLCDKMPSMHLCFGQGGSQSFPKQKQNETKQNKSQPRQNKNNNKNRLVKGS